MNRRERRAATRAKGTRTSSKARRLAAGLTATVAAGGLAAAPAAADTTILACYDNTTFALSYLKPPATTCPSGSTKISWSQTGPQGALGPQGSQGAQGPQGAQGAKGAQGSQGAQGKPGVLGARGKPGAQGPQGAKGTQGAQGAKGAQGPQGAQGKAGAQGAHGTAGAQGASGAQGPQGQPGRTGARGPQGAQGAQGAPGSGPAGYFDYRSSGIFLPHSHVTVVATLTPGSTGPFQVNGMATVHLLQSRVGRCWLEVVNPSGNTTSSTPQAVNTQPTVRWTPMAETGEMVVLSGSTINEACTMSEGSSASSSGIAQDTAITAAALDSRDVAAATSGRSGVNRPENKFSHPRRVRPNRGSAT